MSMNIFGAAQKIKLDFFFISGKMEHWMNGEPPVLPGGDRPTMERCPNPRSL
jgi:hypothetical protein